MYHHSIVSSFSNYTFSLQAYRWDQFFQLHVQVSLSRLLPKGNTKGSSAIKLLNVETRISPLSDVCSWLYPQSALSFDEATYPP